MRRLRGAPWMPDAEMRLLAEPTPEIQEIIRRATNANVIPINRVGAIYARIAHIFDAVLSPTSPNKKTPSPAHRERGPRVRVIPNA